MLPQIVNCNILDVALADNTVNDAGQEKEHYYYTFIHLLLNLQIFEEISI